MDREFGTWAPTDNQKGWDWFSIQLNDNTELMCYQLRTAAGEISPYSSGTFVSEEGRCERLSNEEFTITPTSTWTSPGSGADYPSGWVLEVPKLELRLNVTPVLKDQELDTRGTTMIVYWEGACEVSGTKANSTVEGNAYVELVGYDRSHEQPNLAYFLMGDSLEFIRKFVP
jgi:predicted secreted hydrolase